jgi:hypothetical protein
LVHHIWNRAVARLPVFRKEADYAAFERIMIEADERHRARSALRRRTLAEKHGGQTGSDARHPLGRTTAKKGQG